ncbi:hypothetical protein RHGRI_001170 [Rhododendron griersonianum]|uniref:UDP-N-acetylglucosamine transferase subunit ALG14 n=1 Tax=Rhododendron griersonianum TaxID=479676 RepID=A0AAV6LMB3_9ERIC|nr:hypothetical protein RHGRI_001170 [Rhododendron griersonianum]
MLAMEKGINCCFSASASNVYIYFITIAIALVVIRVSYVIYRSSKPLHTTSPQPLSTLIVLGSGGHTAEMLNLLSVLHTDSFTPRLYIAAATDNMSLQKARLFESSVIDKVFRMAALKYKLLRVSATLLYKTGVLENAQFMQIYRSREVGQSYLTSIGTTVMAIAHALWLMIKIRPQVILCNGPGTCLPLCVIAFFFKVVGIRWSSTFYVESIARVRRLSLTGLLLYELHMADKFFVQWPQLQRKYPRAHYVGCLM